MKKETSVLFALFVFIFLILFHCGFVEAVNNSTMTVEVSILGYGNSSNSSDVSIEVPDYINLGNLTKNDPVSDEKTISINNTGRLAITVTPQLKDSEENIFSYLFFRKQKSTTTNDTTLVQFYRIGDFNLDIDAPLAGHSYRSKSCYMQLNLSDFDGDIKEDLIGYKGDIVFLAMPA